MTVPSICPTLLIIGNCHRTEMQPIKAWLTSKIGSDARLVFAENCGEIKSKFAPNDFPDLIIVLQSWSNEFSVGDVDSLFSFAPLARVVVCYGTWCESDGRNFSRWPISVRVPVWSAISRLEREWQIVQTNYEMVPLPLSASREEVFASDHQSIFIQLKPQSFIIDSPDADYREFLYETLVNLGFSYDTEVPAILLFDGDPWDQNRARALRDQQQQFFQARTYVLLNQATSFEFQQDFQCDVISKLGPILLGTQLGLPTERFIS